MADAPDRDPTSRRAIGFGTVVQAFLTAVGLAMSTWAAFVWLLVGLTFLGEQFYHHRWVKGWSRERRITIFILISLIPIALLVYLTELRSSVSIIALNEEPFIEPIGKAFYIHARVDNNGLGTARCQMFINEFRGDGKSIFKDRHWPVTAMNGGISGDALQAQTIIPNDHQYFDIFYIKDSSQNVFQLAGDIDRVLKIGPFGPGKYEFVLSAQGDNCNSSRRLIKMEYDGGSKVVFL